MSLLNTTTRRVVVTGMGAITPLGHTLTESWHRLIVNNKNDHFGFTTLQKAIECQGLSDEDLERELELSQKLPCQVAAPICDGSIKHDSRTGRFVQLALMASKEAMNQANLHSWLQLETENHSNKSEDDDSNENFVDDIIQERRNRVGVCVGSGMSCVREVVDAAHTSRVSSLKRVSPHFIPKVLANSASGRISLEYKLHGPNHSVSTACAASAHSIGDAYNFIRNNYANVMVAGGTEACIDPISLNGFCRLRALSTNFNDNPSESSRPFDLKRDGFVMGEGSAILVLEELDHALLRGANIVGEVIGYGLSGDSYHVTSPDPCGNGAKRSMLMAMNQLQEEDVVDYVNAHATSTPKGDDIEAKVINETFCNDSERQNPLYVSSTKGSTGHLLGAAGAVEAAFTVLSLNNQIIPPTRNLSDVGEDHYSFRHVMDTLKSPNRLEVALSNSFGFGGTNASLVFKRYHP